jgi:hypothetical protein
MLRTFIRSMEEYIEGKRQGRGNGPFSVSEEDLSFLEDGVEELRYLCWQEIPVFRVQIVLAGGTPPGPEAWESIKETLNLTLVYKQVSADDYSTIYVYPSLH